jgi:RNA polymerase sigma factor (TIGR02999 family)
MDGQGAESKTALFGLVYQELRRMARRIMRGEDPEHTLQPTALVHEAFLRLFDGQPVNWNNREHFFASAAIEMRRALVDYARRRRSLKRQPPDAPPAPGQPRPTIWAEVIELDWVLTELGKLNPRAAAIVDLRYFAGFTVEEVAAALGMTERTVYREWLWARAYLKKELGGRVSAPNALPKATDGSGPDRENETGL